MSNIFSERLKLLRKEKKISQIELAKAIGVGAGVIGDLERGQRNPSKKVAEKLALFFDTDKNFWLNTTENFEDTKFVFLRDSLLALKKNDAIKNLSDLREKKNLDIIIKIIAFELDLEEED